MEFKQALSLSGRKKIANNTYELSFRVKSPPFSFTPGQYVHLSLPNLLYHDPRGNGRDFSLVSLPQDEDIRIAVRESQSGFKKTLLQKRVTATISGPFGVFTLPKATTHHIVFIAGGIGITPFLSMMRFATVEKLPHNITLLYVNKDEATTAYKDELNSLSKDNPLITLKFVFGHVTEQMLASELTGKPDSLFYIAGPPSMVSTTQLMLSKLGVSQERINIEEFSGYKQEFDETESRNEQPLVKAGEGGQETSLQIEKLGEGMEGELAKRSFTDLEALLQALSNTALVSETNASGTITFANDKFVEISKYSREELIGQNHRILKSGYHSNAFYENLWATITRGKHWRGLFKNKAKDGSYYWVDTSIAPILGRDGKPAKYISVRFPITERQLAEEELQERTKQQSVLTVLSQEALVSHDLFSLFETAVNLLSQTLLAEYCAVLKHIPDQQCLVYVAGVGFSRAIKGKTTIYSGSVDSMGGYTLAAKEPVIIEDLSTESRFIGSEMLHDHGIVSGVSVLIHGLEIPFGVLELYSTQKRVFRQDDINFIQAVANLLANAARNQLDKRKDEFLGVASHEMKTPLTSIKTFTQLLQQHAKKQHDETSELFLSKIDQQLDRVSGLIGDLLDISRINAGKIEYKDEQFLLSEVVEEVAFDQGLTTKKHKIILQNGVKQKIYGDKYRIAQVLTNLLTNAIKYSPDGKKIIVKTEKDRRNAIVSVQDFGVGIAKSNQAHVFDRFYQGNGIKQDQFPGGAGVRTVYFK